MTEFFCRVAAPSGEIIERSYEAADEAALRRDLEDKDYLVLDLRRKNPIVEAAIGMFRIRPKVSSREFLFFNQELSALLRAGLPILSSLDILLERRQNQAFRRALADIRDRVKSGEALSDAFAAQGDLFPKLYAPSLASGERSGELPSVLARYIAYTRALLAIRRKVVAAIIYPAILVTMSAGLIALMTFYIIPKFNEFLTDFGADLPLITQVLVDSSTFLQDNWKQVLAGAVAAFVGILAWARSGVGQGVVDRLKLRVPLLGRIAHDYAQNRFTRTLATLVSGGIPLVTSLELAARAVGNLYFERELLAVATKVREGQSLWETLERAGLLSGLTVEMIKVGESTGALVEMLDNASEFTEEEIDFLLTRLVALIEPIMLIFIAAIVGGILLALYLPLIQAYGGQTHGGF